MPLIEPDNTTAPVFFPTENYQIAKYLDLTKFLSILQRRAMFFCRLDFMEDHFEGSIPKRNLLMRQNMFESSYKMSSKFKKKDSKQIQEMVHGLNQMNSRFKSVTCISCWNKSISESAALWKIYSDFHKGIMIVSKRSNVFEAFKDTEERIGMSEIKYIDYENDTIPEGNINWPIIHKHRAYEYENEVRLIHTLPFEPGIKYDWSKEELNNGKYINVDIDALIDEVIISPYSQQWYFDLIKDVCEKYKFEKPIRKSEFAKI